MPTTEYLPTPPASLSEEHPNEAVAEAGFPDHHTPYPFRYATPPAEDHSETMPSFRRRVGRGGRLMFDRRMPMRSRESVADDALTDRFKYDSDDENDEDIVEIDPHDVSIMTHKSYLYAKSIIPQQDQLRRQLEASVAANQPHLPVNGVPQPNVSTAG